jgi:hypothetical protein
MQQAINLISDANIANAVWTATDRSLTTSPGGEGISVNDIVVGVWNNPTRTITATPTGAALASDLLTANSSIASIKGKTDQLTLANIASQIWSNNSRTLTSSTSGGISQQELQAGLATFGVATSTNITNAVTTLTTNINELNDISVNDLLNTVIEGTYTLVQVIRLLAAEASGNDIRSGSNVTFLGIDGVTPRISAACADTGKTITVRNGA